jgi:small subunit ribosomal protein S6
VRRDYEIGYILNPEVNEEQTRAILERIEQIVANYDGQVLKVNQWGRRKLAYPIEHHRDGFYVFIDTILTPETVAELDRTLKVSEEVLRHLIKRRDPKTVQKEREARAAAAAAATPAATPAAPEVQVEAESEAEIPAPAGEEAELPVLLTPEEIENIPPAIEEEEAIEA